MILLKKCLLAFFGLCAGGIIAAGVYAFLAIIGVFVRLMGKTGTRKHIFLYETVIILGGVLGYGALYRHPFHMCIRTVGWDFCGLSGHVPGRDAKGTSGHQPEDSPGRGTSVSDICPGGRENGGVPGIFLESYGLPGMMWPKRMSLKRMSLKRMSPKRRSQKGLELSAAGF